MSYNITQINDQTEGDVLFTTFLLSDSAGIMPDVRVDKFFVISDNVDRRIENQKKIESLFYENEYLNSVE